MSSEYQYQPLESSESDLRLIRIEDGWDGDAIRCVISTHPHPHPPYQALSYVWGDLILPKVSIYLNDQLFLVTANLASALQALRFKLRLRKSAREPIFSGGYFWIDALCIDQDKISERDQQVRRMKNTYQQATRVVVWLGDYHEPGDEPLLSRICHWAMNTMKSNSISTGIKTQGLIRLLSDLRQASLSQPLAEGRLKESEELSTYSSYDWAQLAMLFHRPWFERLWVIQELGASRYAVVQWGYAVEPWQNIEQAAAYILKPAAIHLMPDSIRRILPLMGAHRLTQVALNSVRDIDSDNILTALWHTRGARCSDPRDRLYAILGVVGDVQDIEIDYASPVEEVYRNWTLNRIKRTRSLDILSACANSGRDRTFPSWVPDLRLPWGEDKYLWNWTHYLGPKEAYQPSWEVMGQLGEHRFLFSESCTSLTVDGRYITHITALSHIGDVTTNLTDPTSLTPRLHDIIFGWETWVRENNGTDTWDMAQLTYFQNALLRGGLSKDSKHSLESRYLAWRFVNSLVIVPGDGEDEVYKEAKEMIGDLEGQLFSMIHGSQVFLTASDQVGIVSGSCETQVGDQIWFLVGGFTPFIVREIEGGFRLITPCYFHNHIMKHIADGAGPLHKVILL